MSYWSFFREYWKPALIGVVIGDVLNITLSSFLGFFLGMFGYWVFVKRKSEAA